MNEVAQQAILAHAKAEIPRECCGVIVVFKGKERYVPCRNIATENENFTIHPEDWAKAEDDGNVLSVVHSHCDIPPFPTQADLVACEATDKQYPGLSWVIVNPLTEQFHEFKPSGYVAPLIGREFVHGILDCYALIRDYYAQELKIELPDFERENDWWKQKGVNLYLKNFEKAGFVKVPAETLKRHDVIIMLIGDAEDPNHAAVYLENQVILQHIMNRLSCRDVYGGYWMKHTACVVRHRSLM
jgi:proteasome lid subunit RPN8/RPN11